MQSFAFYFLKSFIVRKEKSKKQTTAPTARSKKPRHKKTG